MVTLTGEASTSVGTISIDITWFKCTLIYVCKKFREKRRQKWTCTYLYNQKLHLPSQVDLSSFRLKPGLHRHTKPSWVCSQFSGSVLWIGTGKCVIAIFSSIKWMPHYSTHTHHLDSKVSQVITRASNSASRVGASARDHTPLSGPVTPTTCA